jgi:APA family basic amino acid/polyamine antiporter
MSYGLSRIYYAIAQDGLLPRMFAKVNPKTSVPQNATLFAGIGCGLVAGLFPLHVLVEMVSIGTLMAFAIVCLSVIVLRKTQPDLKRPFRVPWVPFIPLLGAGVCILQMVSLPWSTWLRLIIWTAVGLAIYFLYGRKRSRLNKNFK